MATTPTQSKSSYALELAKELLDDIELSRLAPENLLFKAIRLARITDNERMQTFIRFELFGNFPKDNKDAQIWAQTVGRSQQTIGTETYGYWEPLEGIYARISTNQAQLNALRIPDLSYAPHTANEYDHVGSGLGGNPISTSISNIISQQNSLRDIIGKLSTIKSRVLTVLHEWVAGVYHEMVFSGQQNAMFERLKARVDTELGARCGDALVKIPSILERLSAKDTEAISQALLTCRRLMDSFCDSVYPPSGAEVEIGGERLQVTSQHTRNRFRAYLQEHCKSDSRRTRLSQTMKNLYDRAGTAVHADVTPEEAEFLFFETYLWIGEVITLPNLPLPPLPQPAQDNPPNMN